MADSKVGVVNIDEHIKRWAQETHKMTAEGNEGKITRVEIVYDKMKIKVENEITSEVDEVQVDEVKSGDVISQVVFKSTFTNTTSVEQKHQFEMERETVASVRTSFTQGFTRSGHVGIKLDTPEGITNSSAGFGPNVQISTSEDKRIVNHSLKWKAKLSVTVPSGKTTVATLIIKEAHAQFKFNADVIMQGDVMVRIVDLAKAETKKVIEYDIASILKKVLAEQMKAKNAYLELPRIPDCVAIDVANRRVVWPTFGNLSFRYGISQDMVVE